MMKITYKVTNEAIFNERVISVEIDGDDSHNFNVNIELTVAGVSFIENQTEKKMDGIWLNITGEHGVNDYKDDYGFILETNN